MSRRGNGADVNLGTDCPARAQALTSLTSALLVALFALLLAAVIWQRRLQREDRLAEPVQARKRAAPGQMSAALSHALNQPLAVVKTCAENALGLSRKSLYDKMRRHGLKCDSFRAD